MQLEVNRASICEVQLYRDAFLALKKQQHKTYELTRVEDLGTNNLKKIAETAIQHTLSSLYMLVDEDAGI